MKIKILIILSINLLFCSIWLKPVFALEHTQRDGLFSMDIPEGWHWVEYPEEVIIAFPDGQTVAIDVQFVLSRKLSLAQIKDTLKESNDKMIKQGIEAHHGTFIDEKVISVDGAYATRLDFKTNLQNPIHVSYISFFNKGYAFTVTYGSGDDKMLSVMDDAVATIKLR